MKISVFIACSLDGYIAGKNGEIDWLEMIPNPNHDDCGYVAFIENIDAILMGRNTFDFVCNYDGDWPYNRPLFVLSNTMTEVPEKAKGKAELIRGDISEVLNKLKSKGLNNIYIDGGKVIQTFLSEDLVDEMIITKLPILLGDGIPLFGLLENRMEFEYTGSTVFLGQLVQDAYKRKRS